MINPIKEIVNFNKLAGLTGKGYDDFLESSFQIEEALEGFPNDELFDVLYNQDDAWKEQIPKDASPKELSRAIVSTAMIVESDKIEDRKPLTDVDRLDKACDAVVFAVGSMAKLGLGAQEITKALNIVMQANMAKLNCPKDEHGKLTKPADFDEKYAPEPKLQELLDKRK